MLLQEHTDRTTLRVVGQIRMADVAGLFASARAASARGLTIDVDLEAADHLHAAAWQILIALQRDARSRGVTFSIVRISDNARHMLSFLQGEDGSLSMGDSDR